MMQFGFPSGKLDKLSLWAAVERNLRVTDRAMEITALRYDEYDDITAAMHRITFPTSCDVSFHAPARFTTWQERYLAYLLSQKPMVQFPVVLHPDAIHDHENWEPLQGRLRIENMDLRKFSGVTVDSLRETFVQLPYARWCFDIGHARQVDPTMRLANELLDAFGDRLDEVHMSEVLPCGKHIALTPEVAEDYRKVFHNSHRNFAVILETILQEESMAQDLLLARNVFG
jgi:hypothetical protein